MISLREAKYDPVHDAQRHFRGLLDSMAHPGQIRDLDCQPLAPPDGLDPAGAATALALLNRDCSFAAYGYSEAVIDYLRQNTRSPVARSGSEAEYLLFARDSVDLVVLASADTGDPAYPETGATVLIQVEALDSGGLGAGALTVTLQGPGVDGSIRFQMSGVSSAVLGILREKNDEYPLGVDTIFTCGERLVSMPRSSRLRWE
jgi:alpha-D-ribose 1-methylphosphonate 5-triphosphate synthase subunit PhnH